MGTVLGISAFYHDSAAALLIDGRIRAAAQEERFTRCKHDRSLPVHAVTSCLAQCGLRLHDIDHVVYYEYPSKKLKRILASHLAYAPHGATSFCRAMEESFALKTSPRRHLHRVLGLSKVQKVSFVEHHLSHAASAFYMSPFVDAAVLTLDGVGEWATTTLGVGEEHKLRTLRQLSFPDSLGLLYSAFTAYCGFKVNDGEYKLMGLAPYGRPCYAEAIKDELIDIRDDGSFRLNMDMFEYCVGLRMTSERFHAIFGGQPRGTNEQLEQRHADLAASIQSVVEDVVCRLAKTARDLTSKLNLVMAGGVALNSVANGKILQERIFDDIWIQPATGDAGGAIGAAIYYWHAVLGRPRKIQSSDSQSGSLLGPDYSVADVQHSLRNSGLKFEVEENRDALYRRTAKLLDNGKVVGWFQGRMEYGPRALGARSILADARDPGAQKRLNSKVKRREGFRPFAPAVLMERASEWFDLPERHASPYMLFVVPVRESKRLLHSTDERLSDDQQCSFARRLQEPRSQIPAVTHVDYSARVQTVDTSRNVALHHLLAAFESLTGCPVLVNTSFNVRGEPIVCTPSDAIRCFKETDIDALVIEDCIVIKEANAERIHAIRNANTECEKPEATQGRPPLYSLIANKSRRLVYSSLYYLVLTPIALATRKWTDNPVQRSTGTNCSDSYWRT